MKKDWRRETVKWRTAYRKFVHDLGFTSRDGRKLADRVTKKADNVNKMISIEEIQRLVDTLPSHIKPSLAYREDKPEVNVRVKGNVISWDAAESFAPDNQMAESVTVENEELPNGIKLKGKITLNRPS